MNIGVMALLAEVYLQDEKKKQKTSPNDKLDTQEKNDDKSKE